MNKIDTNGIIEAVRALAVVEMAVIMPALIVSFIVAIVFGIIQAATQIQEQTLSFFPKLIAVGIVFYLFGDWMFEVVVQGLQDYIKIIPGILG